MILEDFAPAKVNLFLHVGPVRPDGFHPIASLMVFADVGDRLTARPGPFGLEVTGPFAAGVPRDGRNLILKACAALFDAYGAAPPALSLTVEKNLPSGAGLGGGSSDAAAAFRLLAKALDLPADLERLRQIGAAVGSDAPACVEAVSILASGRGEVMEPAPAMPSLDAVLVHPGPPCGTAEVYAAFDKANEHSAADMPQLPQDLDRDGLIAALLVCRNDLEEAACVVEPAAGEVLRVLRRCPEARLARLSGSGSASFAICDDPSSAAELARRLVHDNPDWWITQCRLGGPVLQPTFLQRV